jgi:heterogeneous nuclear ribonucleoprotein A1/A3
LQIELKLAEVSQVSKWSHDPEEREQLRKLFIGVLSSETTDDSLREHSENEERYRLCGAERLSTKHSRNFGFVTCSCVEEVDVGMCARP